MPDKKITPVQPDVQRGLSQDAVEDLRSEFLSIGGIVESLPEIASVRDNTIVMIKSNDHKGYVKYDRWQAIDGQWFWIGRARPQHPMHISGSLDMYNTTTAVAFSGVDALTNITSGWTVSHVDHIRYADGEFKIEAKGEYSIAWSLSVYPDGSNKEYEAGIVLNGSNAQKGWAHIKLSNASDTLTFGSQTIMELEIGDTIKLGAICRTNPVADLIIAHANLTLIREGY